MRTASLRRHRRPAPRAAVLLGSAVLAVAFLVAAPPQPTHAETVRVDARHDTEDPDPDACEDPERPCTLRDAVAAANDSQDEGTIEVPDGTYDVEHGSIHVTRPLRVVGLGDEVVLEGPRDSLFRVERASFTLERLTITGSGHPEILRGGAIHFVGGAGDDLRVVDVTLHRNEAGRGGAIYAAGWDHLLLSGSTIDGNQTEEGGTAVYLGAGASEGAALEVLIENSTISGNYDAEALGQDIAVQIEAEGAVATLRHATVAGNVEPSSGPDPYMGRGIGSYGGASEIVLINSIVAGHGRDCVGEVTSGGHNIASDDSCGLRGVGDRPETDPELDDLADNGGPTRTHAIASSSPAYAAARPERCLATDQRGVQRKDVCDIGAFELDEDPGRPAHGISQYAQYRTTSGWGAHLIGDVTGEGPADLLSFHPRNGRWFLTSPQADGSSSTSAFTTYRTTSGWAGHVLGDVVANGRADLLSFHETGSWVVTAWDADTQRYERGALPRYRTLTGWDEHLTGDVSGDGREELLSYHAGTGRWIATDAAGNRSIVAEYPTPGGWQAHLAGHVRGAARVDLLSLHDNGRWFITSWDEGEQRYATSAFTTYATRFGWSGHVAADLTGDGRAELLSLHASNGQWFATALDGERWRHASYGTGDGWQVHVADDVTYSGRDDVLSYHPSNGTWWRLTAFP